MGMHVSKYIALFEVDMATGTVGVVFPDIPGCVTVGSDFDEAYTAAHEALSLYAEDEPALPKARSLEEIKASWEDWSEWEKSREFYTVIVALYPLKPTTRKFNISLDERLVRRIDRITSNRSAFIANAVEQMLK